MKRPALLLAAALAACSSDNTGVNPDVIDSFEKAAVQGALVTGLKTDTLIPLLSAIVFPFIDRASHVAAGNGEIRIVGVQLDINATSGGTPVVAKLSAILAWRGFEAATRTVDSVFFVIGAGIAPPSVTDALRTRFSPDTAGTGTAFVIHQAPDSMIKVWLARTGVLHVTTSSFGAGTTTSAGGLTLVARRGTLSGDYSYTGKLVPDPLPPDVTAAANFTGGIQAIKMEITGTVQ